MNSKPNKNSSSKKPNQLVSTNGILLLEKTALYIICDAAF
jgi:hypothetical protein